VRTALLYLVAVCTPAAAFWGARVGVERLILGPGRRATTPTPAQRPLERLVADLRRLEQDYRRIKSSDEPHRAKRLRAVALAYDDTLGDCCRAVGLPEPSRPPLSDISRLETEAALAKCGVHW
jgi:hypothetical protein